jgi:hypothetical protein
MKTQIKSKSLQTVIILGSALLFALPLQAGRGGNNGGGGGNGGVCPNGYEAGTRAMEDCTRAQDGTGSQLRNKGAKAGRQDCDGTGTGQGQQKKGRGNGNPEDCPNNNG